MSLASPEANSRIEDEIVELFRPTQKIAAKDCQRGHLYWVGSSFGPTAICLEQDYDGATFLGVTISLGDNSQATASLGPPEKYYYEDPELTPGNRLNQSTVWAFKDLGETPLPPNDPQTLNWLLTQDLEFHEQRLVALQDTAAFRGSEMGQERIEAEIKSIELVRSFLHPQGD